MFFFFQNYKNIKIKLQSLPRNENILNSSFICSIKVRDNLFLFWCPAKRTIRAAFKEPKLESDQRQNANQPQHKQFQGYFNK